MSRLVRVLSIAEAVDGICNGPDGCDADPTFRVTTPLGDLDYCDDHVDAVVDALPKEWLECFSRDRAVPRTAPASPYEQAAAVRLLADSIAAELVLRAAGEPPDRRFDPIIAACLDAAEAVVDWRRKATV